MCLAQHAPACSHSHSLAQCMVPAGHRAPQTPLSALDEAAWPMHGKEAPRISHQLLSHQPGACTGALLRSTTTRVTEPHHLLHNSLGVPQHLPFPPHQGLGQPRTCWGFFSRTSMGSWRPSRVCSEPFPAGLPQWKWSWSARNRPGRPPPLTAMCSEADSPARLSITARAPRQAQGRLGVGNSPGTAPSPPASSRH